MTVYSEAEQELLIIFLLSSNELFVRSRNIIKDSYFDKKFRKTVSYILDYADKNARLPVRQQVFAQTGLNFELLTPEEAKQQEDWFLEHIETFCRHKAMEQAIEASVEQISKGNYGIVQEMVRDALLISLTKDLGLDLFKDPGSFLDEYKQRDRIKSTGWKSIDEKLYGGFSPGELNIFAGAPGTGKSLFLQNLAINWVQMGFDVIYLSLELSEELAGMRINAMITGKTTKEVLRDSEELGKTIKTMHNLKKWGNLTIKYMPIGTTAHNIKSYLKEYEIQKGKKPDCILIDYLDLLHPNSRKVDASNLFVKDKYVSEEIRSLMKECNLLGATASQLNRGAMEEKDHEMYHIAGGISKINTADNVLTIYTSQTLKDSGQIRLQFIKTRSSSGVGQRVFLAYDNTCMRITDLESDEEESQVKKGISEIGEKIRRKATIKTNDGDINVVEHQSTAEFETGTENAATGAALRKLIRKTKMLNDD